LRYGGQIVAELLRWDADIMEGGDLVGKARLASPPNEFYMEHAANRLKLVLWLGKTDIRGKAETATMIDGLLHFHLRREHRNGN
jgi:hypothetical protein